MFNPTNFLSGQSLLYTTLQNANAPLDMVPIWADRQGLDVFSESQSHGREGKGRPAPTGGKEGQKDDNSRSNDTYLLPMEVYKSQCELQCRGGRCPYTMSIWVGN